MSTLLNDLGWANLKTFHITYKNRAFELTEYAGEYTLEKWLKSLKKPVSKTKIIQQKRKARLENKSNIIYLNPSKK